jgi:hypothetical protein
LNAVTTSTLSVTNVIEDDPRWLLNALITASAVVHSNGDAGSPANALECMLQPFYYGIVERRDEMKYGVAWLLGVPVSIIALWFVVNQMGCGF